MLRGCCTFVQQPRYVYCYDLRIIGASGRSWKQGMFTCPVLRSEFTASSAVGCTGGANVASSAATAA